MFRTHLSFLLKSFNRSRNRLFRRSITTVQNSKPVPLGIVIAAVCESQQKQETESWNEDNLGHDFLIRQSTTVNVNAATQLLTVTLVAIQDTSERLRDSLSKEISLVQQAMEWGEEGTPPHHWDQLVAVRGALCDLRHNLRTLFSYMDYAEKIATVAAEISYLSGNVAASDAICERIDHACRTCKTQKQLNQELQQESLELQRRAIAGAPQLQGKVDDPADTHTDPLPMPTQQHETTIK